MKKCIITGSNGYLGSYLVSKFKNLGWDVIELSSTNNDNQIQFKLNEIDNIEKIMGPNESVYIPLGVKHRLSNPTKKSLILINSN